MIDMIKILIALALALIGTGCQTGRLYEVPDSKAASDVPSPTRLWHDSYFIGPVRAAGEWK